MLSKVDDDDDDDASEARRVGVIKSVNAKERTTCVRWLKQVVRSKDPHELGEEEVVSVYELESHPDYDYSYGDAVVRLAPVSASLQIISDGEPVAEPNQQTGPSQTLLTKKHSGHKTGEPAFGNEGFMEFSDLSWVGNITGLRNSDIEVTWADGMVSTVGPQAIFVVSRDDDDSIGAGSEVSDVAASWETVDDDDEEEMDGLENDQEVKWRPLVSSEIKANINFGRFTSGSGLGAVARDSEGMIYRVTLCFIPINYSPTIGEALATRMGVQLIKPLDFQHFSLELDNKLVADKIAAKFLDY